MKVKKGDNVYVIGGNYKGKIAKVLHVFPARNRLIVEGINMIKRHTRPTQKNPKGGVVIKEGTIHRSNVKVYCGSCKSPTRISFKMIESKGAASSKVRVCRMCGAEL